MRQKDGSWRLTWIDLIVAMILLPFVVVFFLGTGVHQHDGNARLKCASNLKMIGIAIEIYADENHGQYPRGRYDPATASAPTWFTHPNATPAPEEKYAAIYSQNGPGPNDVTAAMFRLLQTEEIDSNPFCCPSVDTNRIPQSDIKQRTNFSDRSECSYSFANPYASESAVNAGYKLTTSLSADFAVAADMNPGVKELLTTGPFSTNDEMKKINSPNHNGDGQNVLYGDGHVEWQQHPYHGVSHDNFYTYGKSGAENTKNIIGNGIGAGIIGSPVGPDDSILLPTANQK